MTEDAVYDKKRGIKLGKQKQNTVVFAYSYLVRRLPAGVLEAQDMLRDGPKLLTSGDLQAVPQQ